MQQKRELFDIASCQFAIHYMFQSEAKAHHFFAEVAAHLRPGGEFIATTIDCRVVSEMLAKGVYGQSQLAKGLVDRVGAPKDGVDPFQAIRDAHAKQQQQSSNSTRSIDVANEFGHVVLNMKFSQEMCARLIDSRQTPKGNGSNGSSSSTDDSGSPYGIQYTFTLQDNSDAAAVDAPEWIVPLGPPLEALAEAHGMVVQKVINFQDMIEHMMTGIDRLKMLEK